MRERLIQLLSDEICPSPLLCDKNCKYAHSGNCYADRVADYLLENGVVLLPCKVGDAVYIVDPTSDSVVSGKITHFEYNLYTTPREWITVVSNELWYGKTKIRNRIDLLIGKTVFLTREAAERALRGGAE